MSDNPCGSLAVAAQSYRIAAIASLRETLSQRSIVAVNIDSLLASILLLEISKQFDGASHRSEGDVNHLLVATEPILARGGPQSVTSPCGRFLLTQLLYHDVLSAVSKGRGPLIRRFGLSGKETSSLQLDLESSRGYHATILQAVAQISELKVRKAGGFSPADLMFSGQRLKIALESMDVSAPCSDQAHTTNAHRAAALIYLHRVIYGIGAPHPLTLYHVRRCIDSLAAVPVSSPLVSAHIWPLFTAGCEATGPRDREFVQQRLLDIYKERKIPFLRKVRELIEHVWLGKDFTHSTQGAEGMSRLGCIEIVKRLGEMLHLV
ncbi:fungal-specific transcription factor domain-containing protein [Aspergillus desertorum]